MTPQQSPRRFWVWRFPGKSVRFGAVNYITESLKRRGYNFIEVLPAEEFEQLRAERDEALRTIEILRSKQSMNESTIAETIRVRDSLKDQLVAVALERDGARAAVEDRDKMYAEHMQKSEAERLRLDALNHQLTKERDGLKATLDHDVDKIAAEYELESKKLKAKLAIAREAFNKIRIVRNEADIPSEKSRSDRLRYAGVQAGEIAEEVLAQLGGKRT